MKKRFPGMDDNAFGYGGIIDCDAYLTARLGPGVRLLSETALPLSYEDNCVLSGKPPAENCSVAAAARVFLYWERQRFLKETEDAALGRSPAPPAPPLEVYERAERIAAEKYHYTIKKGVDFWNIDNLVTDLFAAYGSSVRCRAVYLWSFQRDIASEIRAGRPVILNLATGFYGDHTVTVGGYRLYEKSGRIFPMLCVADGWRSGRRYLHLDALKREFGLFGIASVNTAELLIP